jgi:hypothetical protein
MNEDTPWYEKFSAIQLILLGFLLLGVTPLIRNPEYFDIIMDTNVWNSPKMNEVVRAVLADGCIGALGGGWFVYRKRKK